MKNINLADLSVAEAINKLNTEEVTSEDLTSSYLDRIQCLNPQTNSYREIFVSSALEQAREADKLRTSGVTKPLLGLPLSIKDNLVSTSGYSCAGSKMLAEYKSPYNASVVAKLQEDGAVILGRTNMDEFGMGSSSETCYFGTCSNPWDLSLVAGGSSGGAASAVAARLCIGALASDTGGSIRQPAAFCGVTGLKPTYGSVSRYGLIAYGSSLDQIGPLAQDAISCAHLLASISFYDEKDATSDPREREDYIAASLSDEPSTIAVVKGQIDEIQHSETRNAAQNTLSFFERQGYKIHEVELPTLKAAIAAYYIIASAEASSNLARYDGARYGYRAKDVHALDEMYSKTRAEGFGQEVKRRILMGTYVLSAGYFDAYYNKAQKVRAQLTKEFLSIFEKYDLIFTPTTPAPAFMKGTLAHDPLEMYLQDVFTVPVNLAGLPAISFPCGFSEVGTPIGGQFISKHWNETKLLAIVSNYQREHDFHRMTPAGLAG